MVPPDNVVADTLLKIESLEKCKPVFAVCEIKLPDTVSRLALKEY